jgi:hypothetical protein
MAFIWGVSPLKSDPPPISKPRERDQQKWDPVLRPGALQYKDLRMILTPNRFTLWRIMRFAPPKQSSGQRENAP